MLMFEIFIKNPSRWNTRKDVIASITGLIDKNKFSPV